MCNVLYISLRGILRGAASELFSFDDFVFTTDDIPFTFGDVRGSHRCQIGLHEYQL
jgi:hypothetical protein